MNPKNKIRHKFVKNTRDTKDIWRAFVITLYNKLKGVRYENKLTVNISKTTNCVKLNGDKINPKKRKRWKNTGLKEETKENI